jgi:hypothetical protein
MTMLTCARLLIALLVSVAGAHATEAPPVLANGGLEPCTQPFHDVDAEVEGPIDGHVHGRLLISYTESPSFEPEWGVRLYEHQGEYRLLVARYQASVWYSAYREVKPHHFARDPTVPPPGLWINDVSVSAHAGDLLRRVINQEVDGQRASNERMGLDGVSHTFKDEHGHCAATWSPEGDTRAAKLVDIAHSLQMQGRLPWRMLQFAREQYVTVELRELSEESMTPNPYPILLSALAIVAAVASLPLLIAALTLLFPNRPRRKVGFVVWSGIISYGLTGLLGIVLIPLIVVGARMFAYVIPTHPFGAPAVLAFVFDSAPGALLLAWLVLSLVVPIYLRRKGWGRWGERPAAG